MLHHLAMGIVTPVTAFFLFVPLLFYQTLHSKKKVLQLLQTINWPCNTFCNTFCNSLSAGHVTPFVTPFVTAYLLAM
jgi:hypothetical protein